MLHDLAQWLRLVGDCVGGFLLAVGIGYAGYLLLIEKSVGAPWLTGVAVAAGGAFILAVGRGLSWVITGSAKGA
jgi:hypothetical protein